MSTESLRVPAPAVEVPAARDVADEVMDVRMTVASQWQLMWWRFRKHRLAMGSVVVLGLFFLVGIFAEFAAPYDPFALSGQYKFVQPNGITFFDANGDFTPWPGVNGLVSARDPNTLRLTYVPDDSTWYPVRFFVHGAPYKLWGMFPSDIHFVGLGADAPDQVFFLMGTDRLGRDVLSRIIYGARTALAIGFIASLVGSTLGAIVGVVSAYFGGKIDLVIQGVMDVLLSFPIIVLAITVVAVLGNNVVLGIDVNLIIAIALPMLPRVERVVRASALAIRELPYVDAARAAGYSHTRIIFRHIVPNVVAPYLIMLTAFVAQAILAEASLSFLGLGVTEPTASWGLMLSGAAADFYQQAPWMIVYPGIAISMGVFAFNLFGDSLRDWLDPKIKL